MAVMRCLGGWLLLAYSAICAAHPAPFSYLDIHFDEQGARGTLTVHNFDAAHELGLAVPESLRDDGTAQDNFGPLTRLLDERIAFTVDGLAVSPEWQELAALAPLDSLRLEFRLPGGQPGEFGIVASLFAYDSQHQTFVNIYESGTLRHQAILDAGRTGLRYYAGNPQGRWSVVRDYLSSGAGHILVGPDHVLFLFGLLLLGGTAWRLLTIVTAFTIGHSITLSLAVLGTLRPTPGLVEPVIALSVIVVGADNLLVQRQRSGTAETGSPPARDLRPWFAAAFGLVHGFGFASVLQEFGLPRYALAWSLGAFNTGVEIGQLLIVLPLSGTLLWLSRHNARLAGQTAIAGSVVVIAAGAWWFVQRVFPAG